MRSFISAIRKPIILLGIILLAGACNPANMPGTDIYPTVTPLAGMMISTPQPTSTPASSPTPDITASEDFLEGMRQRENQVFELSVTAFRRAYQDTPDDERVQTALAEAYLNWGQMLVSTSEGDPERLSAAADKFVSGLEFAPEDSDVYNSLKWEQNVVQIFLQGVLDLEKLVALRKSDVGLEAQQKQAEQVLEVFAAAYDDHPALPGLRDTYAAALLVAAKIAEELGNEQNSRTAALPYWEKAVQLSEQGQAIVISESDTQDELVIVARRADQRINPPPTAVPVRQPQPQPPAVPANPAPANPAPVYLTPVDPAPVEPPPPAPPPPAPPPPPDEPPSFVES